MALARTPHIRRRSSTSTVGTEWMPSRVVSVLMVMTKGGMWVDAKIYTRRRGSPCAAHIASAPNKFQPRGQGSRYNRKSTEHVGANFIPTHKFQAAEGGAKNAKHAKANLITKIEWTEPIR